jgi:hypothetical protein
MGISGVITDKSLILNAIALKKGVIRHAAAAIDIEPKTIYDWMRRDPEVEKAVREARENAQQERTDLEEDIKNEAYDSMMDLLKKRDNTATIFALKSKCGWSEKYNIHGSSELIFRDSPFCEQQNTNSL